MKRLTKSQYEAIASEFATLDRKHNGQDWYSQKQTWLIAAKLGNLFAATDKEFQLQKFLQECHPEAK